jgi:ORF6N domain-containing protein
MRIRVCTPEPGTAVPPAEHIAQSILFLRGQRVILDRGLAAIYGVETRTLNQAVKRNSERFPEDFMFQRQMGLSWQGGTLSEGGKWVGAGGAGVGLGSCFRFKHRLQLPGVEGPVEPSFDCG